jgi:hypothetical protein
MSPAKHVHRAHSALTHKVTACTQIDALTLDQHKSHLKERHPLVSTLLPSYFSLTKQTAMILNFASILSGVVLALPMTSVLANPIPSILEETTELEKRGNQHRPKTHCVTVGAQGKPKYDPEYVNANVGDYIEFELYVVFAFLCVA